MLARFADRAERHERRILPLLILLAPALRLAALPILAGPPESDALAYLAMAESLAAGGPMTDIWGQHIFYSAGYPIFLALPVALGVAPLAAALATNLLLAALSAWLLDRLGRALGIGFAARGLALLLFAVWLPGIQHAALVARENLSVPLMLLLAWSSVAMLRGSARAAGVAGASWAAAILAGGSAIGTILAPFAALWFARGRVRQCAMLTAAAALVLAPWAIATTAWVGRPALNSSSGFNLYLGNNPAATGRFVSIADTPAGPRWEGMRDGLGELGASEALGGEARVWAAAHPGKAARLMLTKLALFWAPNAPDAADFAASRLLASVRIAEVAQYLMFLVGGLAALAMLPLRQRTPLAALIAGYWLVHGLAYIIPRYRDPVMPLLILLCATLIARLIGSTVRANPTAGASG